jgi:localization factor PodJL
MSPALDRIQGGMSELAAHIAEAEAHRRISPSSRAESQAVGEAAPALRSALAADALDAFARKSQIARSPGSGELDHFDVVDLSPPTRESETWDMEAAEALAKIYEGGEAGAVMIAQSAIDAVPPTAAEEPAAAPVAATLTAVQPMTSADPASIEIASQIAARQAEVLENERRWLDERFSQIAARLELSIAGISADGRLETIDNRFAGLEKKLGEALDAALTRADLAGLKSIENQVEDLTAQLVTVQTHFSRLDTIELELRSLAERISSEKIAEIMETNAPRGADSDMLAGAVASGVAKEMPRIEARLQSLAEQLSSDKLAALVGQNKPAAVDTGAIARMVAELVSQQLPQAQPAVASNAPAIDDLRMMMETFAAEQRHGDEQINTMLDTMQQAMIRMLDRMDALEQNRYQEAEPTVAQQPAYADQTGYSAPAAAYEPPQSVREDLRYRPEAPAEYSNYAPPGSYQTQQPAARAQGEPTSMSTVAESKPAENRDDFVAAARRAARKAAENPPEQVEPSPAPETRKVKINPAPKSGRSLSGISMAMICLLLVGGGFAAVRTFGVPGLTSSSTPTKQSPAAAPTQQRKNEADKRVQNLDDADLIIEDERKGAAGRQQSSPAPAQPRRSSLDGNADGMFVTDIPTASLQNAAAVPAALTKDQTGAAAGARPANPMPPVTIGPSSLRSAAAKGDPSAEYEVGVRFAEGKGVAQDLQQAVAWYQRAASQGFAPAQYRLGSMFERGLGLKADLARARVWYQRAAEQGIVKAMHNLAVLSAGRDNSAVDYASAARWFIAAAEHGLTDSQFNLAIMHDSGLGMERDPKQAYKWFSLAARAGDDEAARRREGLRAKLTPPEVDAVEAEIRAWRPKQAAADLNDPRLAGEIWKQRAR